MELLLSLSQKQEQVFRVLPILGQSEKMKIPIGSVLRVRVSLGVNPWGY